MNKKSKIAFNLSLIIYPFDLRFSFNETDNEVFDFMNKNLKSKIDIKNIQYESDFSDAFLFIDVSGAGLIRMRYIPSTPKCYNLLQHEITHYVYFILSERISMKHNRKTTEAYSYLTGYITEKVYEKIFK